MKVGPRTTRDGEIPTKQHPADASRGWTTLDGMTGFNGGDPYTVSTEASLAVLNTHVCTATSLLTWLTLDIIFFGKPSVIGATQGMITGLVCITPAAGTTMNHSNIHDIIYIGASIYFKGQYIYQWQYYIYLLEYHLPV